MTTRERASRFLHELLQPRMSGEQWQFYLTTRRGEHHRKLLDRLELEFDHVAGEAMAEFALSLPGINQSQSPEEDEVYRWIQKVRNSRVIDLGEETID